MAVFTPDKEPRYYSTTQTINWTANPSVRQVASSINSLPPAISEYIAYDTLNPPNPFLAVTQDGKGNVVYDGGFPKFYNTNGPLSTDTTFGDLNGSFKFLYNALNFTANPEKVAAGNKKVLAFGDAILGQSYSLKGTNASDFRTSFERLCNIAGFTLTIKDRDDWGGTLTPTFAELDQYACIIVMASVATDNFDVITNSSVQDIVTYREQGNGMILITDHGPVLSGMDAAMLPHTGFFTLVNRIAVNFGAYFTDDYDRTPVNVGFLRSTYGDHPLYSGMADAEDIWAGGSESRVVVTEVTTYSPTSIPPTDLTIPGKHEVNFLGLMDDGSVVTERYAFTVVDGEFIYPGRLDRTVPTARGLTTFRGIGDIRIENLDAELGTLFGRIYVDGVFAGTFQTNQTDGTTYQWAIPGSTGFPTFDNVTVDIQIDAPIRYASTHSVETQPIPLSGSYNTSLTLEELQSVDASGLNRYSLVEELADYVTRHYGGSYLSLAAVLQRISLEQRALLEGGGNTFPTVTPHTVATSGDIDAELNVVGDDTWYIMDEQGITFGVFDPVVGSWEFKAFSELKKILPYPCTIQSASTGNPFNYDGVGLTPI